MTFIGKPLYCAITSKNIKNRLCNIYLAQCAIILYSVNVHFLLNAKEKPKATLYITECIESFAQLTMSLHLYQWISKPIFHRFFFTFPASHFFYVIIFLNRIARRKKTRYVPIDVYRGRLSTALTVFG